jgi:hypothetical protein
MGPNTLHATGHGIYSPSFLKIVCLAGTSEFHDGPLVTQLGGTQRNVELIGDLLKAEFSDVP